MPDGSKADALIAAACRLSAKQLSDLAEATRKDMGRGISSYMGLGGKRKGAIDAARTAGESAGRGGVLEVKAALLNDSLLRAAVEASSQAGRDASAVVPAWDEFKSAADSGDGSREQSMFRKSSKVLRRGLGRSLYRDWLDAGIGANWALAAVVTWDLVTEDGPYFPRHRDALTTPWRCAAPFPSVD